MSAVLGEADAAQLDEESTSTLSEEAQQAAYDIFYRLDTDSSDAVEFGEFAEVFGAGGLVTLRKLVDHGRGKVSASKWIEFIELIQKRKGTVELHRYLKYCLNALDRFDQRRRAGLTKVQWQRVANLFNCMDITGDNSGTIEKEVGVLLVMCFAISHNQWQSQELIANLGKLYGPMAEKLVELLRYRSTFQL